MESQWEAKIPTDTAAYSASYTNGTGSVPVVEQPGFGVDHTSHLVIRLKSVQLNIWYVCGSLWAVWGELYIYLNPLLPELQVQWELQADGIK
jgi:hypothetical protein